MTKSSERIAVVGLGSMGSSLARSLLKAGLEVQVWNRSPKKSAALQKIGAIVCSRVSEAIEGSCMIIVCLSNYTAWKGITDDKNVRKKLDNVTVIQLTGGNMHEVRQHSEQMAACGAKLVEGAILCFPEQIGTNDASMIVAGQKDIVDRSDTVLRAMSPNITYLGDNHEAPVVLGRAVISSMLGFLIGTINGAAMCKTGGVPLSVFRTRIAANDELMRSEPLRLIDAIAAGNTQETRASLSVWGEGHDASLDAAQILGVDTTFHDGIRSMFEKSVGLGLADHDLSAMEQAFILKKKS